MSQLHQGLAAGLLVIGTLLSQAGCTPLAQYDITLNDQIVYQPTPAIRVGGIADPGLKNCLEQTLIDAQISEHDALEQLNCSDAGIVSLAGLEQFPSIRSLKLSGNGVRNLLVLERLTDLQQLWLDSNDIVDPIPVLRIRSLRQLDLADNPGLQCPSSDQIPASMHLTLPDHCKAT